MLACISVCALFCVNSLVCVLAFVCWTVHFGFYKMHSIRWIRSDPRIYNPPGFYRIKETLVKIHLKPPKYPFFVNCVVKKRHFSWWSVTKKLQRKTHFGGICRSPWVGQPYQVCWFVFVGRASCWNGPYLPRSFLLSSSILNISRSASVGQSEWSELQLEFVKKHICRDFRCGIFEDDQFFFPTKGTTRYVDSFPFCPTLWIHQQRFWMFCLHHCLKVRSPPPGGGLDCT